MNFPNTNLKSTGLRLSICYIQPMALVIIGILGVIWVLHMPVDSAIHHSHSTQTQYQAVPDRPNPYAFIAWAQYIRDDDRTRQSRGEDYVGLLYSRLGDLPSAMRAFQQANRLQPNNPYRLYNLGLVYQKLGYLDKAATTFEHVLRLQPKWAVAYWALGQVYTSQGRNGDAVSAFRKALKLSPNMAAAYLSLGISLGNLRRYDESIAALQMCQRLGHDMWATYDDLGKDYIEIHQYQKASTCFSQALRLKPTDRFAQNGFENANRELKKQNSHRFPLLAIPLVLVGMSVIVGMFWLRVRSTSKVKGSKIDASAS